MQLLPVGRCDKACFVRKSAKYCKSETNLSPSCLQRLGISRAAVAYALEQWAASRNMLHEQIGYLAEAGPESLAAARKLAAEEVVPHLLLSNSTQDLEALMAHLRCSPDSSAGPLEVASCYLKLQVRSYRHCAPSLRCPPSSLMCIWWAAVRC